MAQIFHPSMNTFSKVTIFGGLLIIAVLLFSLDRWNRSAYVTEVNVVRTQPVQFSHDHHVSGLGIDCRYCHTSVEVSASAGLPSTETCMSCHSQVWKDSPMLAPVRESLASGKPLRWTRVHDVPDFVYFNHSVHVAKGVGCETCHGRVDQMPLMRRTASLQMNWCLSCHEKPEQYLRAKEDVFKFDLPKSVTAREHGPELAKQYGIDAKQLMDCGVCHR